MITGQFDAPLFGALRDYAGKGTINFHMPAHKQGRGLPAELATLTGRDLWQLDVTELAGLDDLHRPQGVIAQAQQLAAQVYGAGESFFLINGSTVGLQALLLALGQGKKIILPRNCHRAVLGGLILSGAEPEYLTPRVIPDFGIAAGVSAEQIQQALLDNPTAEAVLTVRPNYYGLADDLAAQVRVTHAAGKPHLVDEAHGAHLRFHRHLPEDAMAVGADASVQSTHKMGGSLTQSSLLHLREGALLAADAVAGSLDLLQSTSPSYLLLASLDLARRQLARQGSAMWDRAIRLAAETGKRLAQIKGLRVLTEECLPADAGKLDPAKLVVAVDGLGLTGFQVSALLAERYGLYLEMADWFHIVALFSNASTRGECDALVAALRDIAQRDKQTAPLSAFPDLPTAPLKRMRPREAWFAPRCEISLEKARGRICADLVAVYPPGIPLLCPGEEISAEIQAYLQMIDALGLHYQGPVAQTLKNIQVVVE